MAAASMMSYRGRDSYQHEYQQHYAYYQARAQTEVASGLTSNPYSAYQPMAAPQHQVLGRTTQPSVSPSAADEGNKPSLPSISNLLGIADGDRSTQESSAQAQAQAQSQQQVQQQSQHQEQQHPQHPQQRQQQQHNHQQQQQQHHLQLQQAQHAAQAMEQRSRASYPMPEMSSSQRTVIPPTPPLRSDSVMESTQSPSTISTGSSISAQPYYLGSSLNNMEPHEQRVAAATQFIKRHSVPSQPSTSPYGASPYTSSPYTTSPGALSANGSFYSPEHGPYPSSAMYHQRPLPSNFPPAAPVIVNPPPPSSENHNNSNHSHNSLPTTANPWEHHHYISASSQATFPQSQDRYICQTCNKAFSRPSSLKIHSHSHTGEKPFKCPHSGCGKAFSVRSNMKRHERGCHTGLGGLGSQL